jgi:hypothetical protein
MAMNPVRKDVEGRLTTVEMVQREGRGPTIDLVTCGCEDQVLDELIDALGQLRTHLSPPVPDRLDDHPSRVVVPAAMTLGRARSGELLLAVRHPGFGWLTFSVAERARSNLLEGLSKL